MRHTYVVKVYRDDNVLCCEITLDRSIESPADCAKTSMEREVIESVRRGEKAAAGTIRHGQIIDVSPQCLNLTIGRIRK